MHHLLSSALFGAAFVLIVCGLVAEISRSRVPQFFPGSLRNKAIWLLVGGAALAIAGLFALTRSSGLF